MSELLNIAPLVDHVSIRGATVTVRGIDIEEIAGLLTEFPILSTMIKEETFDVVKMLSISKRLSAALIAHAVDEIDEANAMNLALSEKVEILNKVKRLTMPGGFGPLRDAIMSLVGIDVVAEPTREVKPISAEQSRKRRQG